MQPSAADRAAEILLRNRDARERLGPLPASCRPRTVDEGYAVQAALHRRQREAGGGPLAGYKIGCTTQVMQDYLGIDTPSAGGVLARDVHHRAARIDTARHCRVGFEGEVAVRVGRDLDAAGAPYAGATVAGAVEALHAAIEVVDERYQDWAALGVPTLLADDFFQAGCVLGEPVVGWRGLDLPTLVGRLHVDGEEVASGTGRAIMGHPLEALAWLANLLAAQGRPLAAGHLVLLGSLVETRWLAGRHVVEFEVGGLGAVRVDVA